MSRLVEASKEVESPVHSRNWRTSFFLAVLDTIQIKIYLLFIVFLDILDITVYLKTWRNPYIP